MFKTAIHNLDGDTIYVRDYKFFPVSPWISALRLISPFKDGFFIIFYKYKIFR